MNFAFSEEQEEFRSVLRRFLEETSPTTEAFRLMETPEGYDRAVWKQMAAELGLHGIAIPEAYGGQGFGPLELGIACEEMGRVLFCGPWLSSICLAANAILLAGSEEQKKAMLPGIAGGETVATLALLEAGGSWDPSDLSLAVRPGGSDGFRISGEKRFVTDGDSANLVLVAARRGGSEGLDGISLLCVRGDASGLSRTTVEPLDPTRRLAHLRFDDTPAICLGGEGAAGAALATTIDRACVALASDAAGGAQRCLDSAVAYAQQRVQFARPIGSFQAVQHKCAEVLLEVESAKSAAYWAGWAAAENEEELPLAASVAKSFCDEAYLRAAAENLHIHGGIGFTWEADPHLYLRRARANAALLGGPAFHHTRIAQIENF